MFSYYGCMTVEHNAPDDNETTAKVFKALSDPVRLEIIRYLKKVGRGVTCKEVGLAVDITRSAGSYHFRTLREAGLIHMRKDAREKYVTLDYEAFDRYVTHFFDSLN